MKSVNLKKSSLVIMLCGLFFVIFIASITANNLKSNKGTIILATTTSTEDSGLLDYLLPIFTKDTGIKVKVISVGTGKALQLGRDGEADVLLVHAKSDEEQFVAEGHGLARYDVMYNDFILIGPKNDPANILKSGNNDIVTALKLIHKSNQRFISRGDESGTHKLETKLWQKANLNPTGKWYVSAGKGMGEVILMADELQAYTITDRATFLNLKSKISLTVIIQGDQQLFNQYGVIAVNPAKNRQINRQGANAFVNWILSPKAQQLIAEFGKSQFGESLFIPNAKPRK